MTLVEELASWCHYQWIHWMDRLFDVGTVLENGDWVIPKERVERWKRLMKTHYSELTEAEKASDRDQARKLIRDLKYLRPHIEVKDDS